MRRRLRALFVLLAILSPFVGGGIVLAIFGPTTLKIVLASAAGVLLACGGLLMRNTADGRSCLDTAAGMVGFVFAAVAGLFLAAFGAATLFVR